MDVTMISGRSFVCLLVLFSSIFGITVLSLRRISPLNFVRTEKPEDSKWIIEGKTLDLLEENTTRCEVEDLGCFTLIKDAKPSKVDADMTLNSCFEFCFQSKKDYAGLQGKGRCFCSDVAANYLVTPKCDLACSSDNSENCTDENSIRLYRKRKGCNRGLSSDLLLSVVIGSVQLPVNLTGAMSAWKNPNMTDAQCLLKCESLGMILALPIRVKKTCLCSDLTSMFTSPERMKTDLNSNTSFGNGDGWHILYRTNVEECRPKRFLRPKQGQSIVLMSHPGSGNTWSRHLIEVATGIYTGSVYGDGSLNRGGFLGEKLSPLSRRTIVVKNHMLGKSQDFKRYTSAILILRNPYDAGLADYARAKNHNGHTALLDPKRYESEDFKAYSKVQPLHWLDRTTKLFDIVPNILVVYYEDLVDDPVREVRRIVSFLPQDIVPQGQALDQRLLCMKLDLMGTFKRPPKGLKRNPYDLQLQKSFDEAIKNMDKLLRSKKKAPLPKSYYEKWHGQECRAAGVCHSIALPPLNSTEAADPHNPSIEGRAL